MSFGHGVRQGKKQAYEALAANARTAHIPVIALTANAMRSEIRSGMAAGFFRYLTKPIDLDVLHAAINDALGGST